MTDTRPRVPADIRNAVIEWARARKALGSRKVFAHRLGITTRRIDNIMTYYRSKLL